MFPNYRIVGKFDMEFNLAIWQNDGQNNRQVAISNLICAIAHGASRCTLPSEIGGCDLLIFSHLHYPQLFLAIRVLFKILGAYSYQMAL